MPDVTRTGRASDDRDSIIKQTNTERRADAATTLDRVTANQSDWLGRDEMRRAKAYSRARGRI